jgi:hypothetical protein
LKLDPMVATTLASRPGRRHRAFGSDQFGIPHWEILALRMKTSE